MHLKHPESLPSHADPRYRLISWRRTRFAHASRGFLSSYRIPTKVCDRRELSRGDRFRSLGFRFSLGIDWTSVGASVNWNDEERGAREKRRERVAGKFVTEGSFLGFLSSRSMRLFRSLRPSSPQSEVLSIFLHETWSTRWLRTCDDACCPDEHETMFRRRTWTWRD